MEFFCGGWNFSKSVFKRDFTFIREMKVCITIKLVTWLDMILVLDRKENKEVSWLLHLFVLTTLVMSSSQ